MADDAEEDKTAGLTSREGEILQFIAQGQSNKHIARHLQIAEATLKVHVRKIVEKMGVSNRTQLAASLYRTALRERLPAEKPAPIRISVQDNILKLDNPKHQEGSLKRASIERWRRSASDTLRQAFELMRGAKNLDPRLVPACSPLLDYLETEYDDLSIEGLGHKWELVSTLIERYSDEVPDIALLQMQEALKVVNVIINQFEEWRDYIEAKTALEISGAEAETIVAEASELAEDL